MINEENITQSDNNKELDKIETITPENIETPDYSYWKGQDTLDAKVAIRNLSKVAISWKYEDILNKPNVWNCMVWNVVIPWGDVNISITWIGFKPNEIHITASQWKDWNNSLCWWYWCETNGNIKQVCRYSQNNLANTTQSDNRLFRFSATETWLLVSFDNDWFTLKSSFTCNITYICKW